MKWSKTRVGFFGVLGGRQVAAAALVMVSLLFLLPVSLLSGEPLYCRGGEFPDLAAGEDQPSDEQSGTQTASRDRGRAVRLQKTDGTIVELSMADYLWGVVAAEMPASFEEEALKAQVCAARTYTVLKQNAASEKHPGADICGDSTCCQAYVERAAAEARWGLNAGEYGEKIDRAVAETDGLGILYQGQPIQALFFSSAPGKTVDAVEVWGRNVDYLTSVDSPEGEEVPNYRSQVVLTAEEVKKLVLADYPGADLSVDPGSWFGRASRNEGGTVSSILLGGVTLTGSQVRTLFSLRSAAFTVTWDGTEFTFDVTGYGHGVGMSQYGANAMAKEGKTFRDILTWYYTGTQVDQLW
ncbi:stage II sporulation protein D [Pseudoflavonifractor phocaeensis]|uniref:stage II sporulation protein D n=1 Tax=Pseudoflavonifractor phocaeensis TaxID=1870988 RepID=UPI001F3D7063|nr:stage II sporulation protein D [Pseudoflavonifractor phocaeensis]MCF2597086.1 stage II sporulation protein D [Pseudoflavonifractor phocaeensis]